MQLSTMLYLALAAVAVHFALDCDTSLYFSSYNNAVQKSFEDQVIWITGASSGIGAQLARDFSVSGAHVIISARRTAQLEEVAKECKKLGAKSVTISQVCLSVPFCMSL